MKKRTIIAISLLLIMLAAAILLSLFYFGILHINNPRRSDYPVFGVDVSAYQGEVDWKVLAAQDISFAYIKATEGSSFTDKCFAYNWENAAESGLRIGAYHFFSFESAGETQAHHFTETVEPVADMLPPVVDVEFYGRFQTPQDIDTQAVAEELRSFVDQVTEDYGMKPVIYASKESYESIIKNRFDDCDLWLRSVYSTIDRNTDWTFWQFSNRHRLQGYKGEEKYIDMNVFCGSVEEFMAYPERNPD